ncbi:MAG: hypothetical protein AAB963_00455 [Patescibacteria group bacterium]
MIFNKKIKWADAIIIFVKKKILYILAFLFIIVQLRNFFSMSFYNFKILCLLLPFILIFCAVWEERKTDKPLNKDSLLTFSSIILAILFFLFQDFQMAQDKINTLSIITAHNCDTARNILQLKNKPTNFGLNSFLVEDYKNNYAFVLKNFGTKNILSIKTNTQRMEGVNTLLRITQDNIDQNTRDIQNKQIVDITKKIIQDICLKTDYPPKNLIDKFLRQLSKWVIFT